MQGKLRSNSNAVSGSKCVSERMNAQIWNVVCYNFMRRVYVCIAIISLFFSPEKNKGAFFKCAQYLFICFIFITQGPTLLVL